jgi:hypothetical protein
MTDAPGEQGGISAEDGVFTRDQGIAQVREKLERTGFPRLMMSFLVALTGGVGFLTSYLLLNSGLDVMWLRYLIAVSIAYGFFLLLLRLWVQRRLGDLLDIPDFSGGSPSRSSGGGVDSDDLGNAADALSGADELAIPFAIVLFAGALILSSLFVIYTAPTLFAEVLLDALLAAGLYRRLRHIESHNWLQTAIRCTIWPFVLTAIGLAVAGWAMAHYFPGADSIGDVMRHTP